MDDQNTRWFLGGLASVGVVSTGVLSAMASFKVAEKDIWYLPWRERLKRSWKEYIPAALIALGTIGCIVGGNIMADTFESGLLLAASVHAQNRERLDGVFKEDHKPRGYRAPDELLWFDTARGDDGGYFSATMEQFVMAMYELNRMLQEDEEVTYSEFYRLLDIPIPPCSEDKGWSIGAGVVYGYRWINITRDLVVMDDGLECNVIRFTHPPTYDYLNYTPDEAVWQGWIRF